MKQVRGEGFSVRFTRKNMGTRDTRKATTRMSNETDIPEQEPLPAVEQKPATSAPFFPASSPVANQKLWEAARKGDCYSIRMAVMEGADLESRDMTGRTAINIATQYNQQQALKTLLAAREMKRMAVLGDLPNTKFYRKITGKTAKDQN